MAPPTPEQRSKLPKNAARMEPPPSVKNDGAYVRLCAKLDKAVRGLKGLMADPIVIAASPNRFNDIYWSDWRAIRFGSFFTERHDYAPQYDYEADLAKGPAGARSAQDLLDRLEMANWRDLFSDAFGLAWNDQILALVLQDGLAWLVFSASNNTCEDHVFALWNDEQPLLYFGECTDRFDWTMQESPPLQFRENTL